MDFLTRLGVTPRVVWHFLSLFREKGGESLYNECLTLATRAGATLPSWDNAIDFVDTVFDDSLTKPLASLLRHYPDGAPSIVGPVSADKYFPRTVRTGHLRAVYVMSPSLLLANRHTA